MNHIALSLVTKGILNNSRITCGFISYEIVVGRVVRKHGSAQYSDFVQDYAKIREVEPVDCINIKLNWADRPVNYGDKKIYVEFIKKSISAELMLEKSKINIELID